MTNYRFSLADRMDEDRIDFSNAAQEVRELEKRLEYATAVIDHIEEWTRKSGILIASPAPGSYGEGVLETKKHVASMLRAYREASHTTSNTAKEST